MVTNGDYRSLVEIDPYLNVVAFTENIAKTNIYQFLISQGCHLDMIFEQISLPDPQTLRQLKYFIREHAKTSKIPVISVRG